MTLLIFGLILFLGIHSAGFLAPSLRNGLIARVGENGWKGIAGFVALIGFAMVVWGYGDMRIAPVAIWAPPVWTRHLALLLMLPVFPLLVATYLPGRIQRATKHPTLIAVILWGSAHLLANGNLADIVLFGSFLAWASIDRISLMFRTAPPVQGAPESKSNDAIAISIGVMLYFAFLFGAHAWMFGISPLGVVAIR
jgi:uncharacterized membrane protein